MARPKRHKLGRLPKARRREERRRQQEQKAASTRVELLSGPLDHFFLDDDLQPPQTSQNGTECDSDGFYADEFYVILEKPYRYYADTDLDLFVSNHKYRLFSDLREACKKEIQDTGEFGYLSNSSDIKFIQTYDSDNHWSTPRIKACISINTKFQLSISVHGMNIPNNHEIWSSVGRLCHSVEGVKKALNVFGHFKICCGNQDEALQELVPVGVFLDVGQNYRYQGYRESHYIGSTIRSTKCDFIIHRDRLRCEQCRTYRRTLRKALVRRESIPKVSTPKKDWKKSKVNNSKLTNNQKLHKIKQLKQYTNQLENEVARLTREVNRRIQREGVLLNERESSDLKSIMESSEAEVSRSFPDDQCYQRLFWEQQRKYANLKNKCSMRWHPMIIKWCIYLKSKSSSAYDSLRNTGFIKLPSERTLFDYTSVTQKGVGFKSDIVDMLMDETDGMKGHQRIVGLLQDEIRIKSDLVYDRNTGELIGFVDLGKVSNDLLKIDEKDAPSLAKYILVLMVRGISTNLKYPLAHFATAGVTSDQLFLILWQAVEILEFDVGLEVLFITSDGASPNRRFIKLHQTDNEKVFKANNVFAPNPREIFFISDAPHLIKTTRNCFANSYSHKKTRRMWKEGRYITWKHIVNLYKEHCTGVLRLCPKLTSRHINLTAFATMKVKLATQVLSSTVAHALEINYGDRVAETVKFIRHMNKFFDCMNTRNVKESVRTRNLDRKEYRSVDDERLTYLTNDFLGYFRSWKNSVDNRQGVFSKAEKSGMMLSHQTLEGLEITVNSVVHCIRFCLNRGMSFVLTERFNQDPIEQHFGIHRSSLGCNTNPNLQQFNHSMAKIRTVGSQALAPVRGNTQRAPMFPHIDDTPLRKRKNHPL